MIDATSASGLRAAERLRSELIIWLTTVRPDGRPQPVPVWFLWDGSSFLVYSQPNRPKLRNIRRNPHVALNLNSDPLGDDVVRIDAEAEIDEAASPADQVAAYVDKYREAIARLGMTPASFARSYSVPIRITPIAVHVSE